MTETGRRVHEFVQDAMAGYVDELAELRATLGRRYADLKSGTVEAVSGDEFFARLAFGCLQEVHQPVLPKRGLSVRAVADCVRRIRI